MTWSDNKRWSDKFIPTIKPICGQYVISEAPAVEDMERNTDLIVLNMQPVRIACRIRRNKFMRNYGDEFTIRCKTKNNAKTELSKIIEGFGDYFFYGFSNENEDGLEKWKIADLNVFRLSFMRKLAAGLRLDITNNHDNATGFCSFKWCDFPPELILAESI